MFTNIASHLTGTSVCSLTLLPNLLTLLYVHWYCFLSYWHFCMLTEFAFQLTGTSVCSLTLLPILLALLYVHWHCFPTYWHFIIQWYCFPSYWHFCIFTDIASHLTRTSVCSLTFLPILLALLCSLILLPSLLELLYVHWQCFLPHWQFCISINTASYPIALALLCDNWHYCPSHELPSLYSQNQDKRKQRLFWMVWRQHVAKWNLDKHFGFPAEAWIGCYLLPCYDVFIKAGCGGLHYRSNWNEVLPCVQVKLIAVGFLS